MSALPVRKTARVQPLVIHTASSRISSRRKRSRMTQPLDADSKISIEVQAKANHPNNPRAQELEIKLKKGQLTPEERAEFRKIVANDDSLLDRLCWNILDGVFILRK